jgi:Phage-related protein, tail component
MSEFSKLHMSINTALRGAGGGGGGSPRQPIESPDSLRSIAYARIVDLVGEGEIVGFSDQTNPLSCVYLNETPVANGDGSLNFRNIQIDSRVGTQTQDPLPDFNGVESENLVGVELRQETPWVRSLTNTNIDSVRLRLSAPVMTKQNATNGDINGSYVAYKIEVQTDGGTFNTKLQSAFSGKATSKYERTHRIQLPKANNGWTIRVTRITPNSTSSLEQNATYVESYTEIIEAKLRMPMSALVSLIVDAEQFNNIPSRAYHLKGRIIRVPSNYDPDARTYSGVWDGTFQSRYSNNPAWVFYDMALNDRYGLGHLIPVGLMDKWALYRIAQYCDGMVDDGKGGQEPRFTCNIVLQAQNDALRVMQDLATVFRGIIYASGGAVTAVGDMPEDSWDTYTPANVIDGRFVYSGSNRKVRHTVALVSWSDMSDFGRAKVEYVEDQDGIARYGIQQTEIIAVGCTSQGQAHRWGRYLLATERYETDSVTFDVGLGGKVTAPGKIIKIADPLRQGMRRGGRIRGAIANGVEVDLLPSSVVVGDSLIVTLPDGTSEMRTINQMTGNFIYVNSNFSAIPVAQSVWAVESVGIPLQEYRVIGVAEIKGDMIGYNITAIEHESGKFAYADTGVLIDSTPIPGTPSTVVPPPTGLQVTHRDVADQNTAIKVVNLSWNAVNVASSYNVLWRQSEGSWVDLGTTGFNNIDINGVLPGGFEVQVMAINSLGVRSVPAFGGPYDIPPVGTPPGYVEQINNNISQEIIDRLNGDAEAIATAAADATAKADAAREAAIAYADVIGAQVADIIGADEWVTGKDYPEGDLVKHNGTLYRALRDNNSVEPGASGSGNDWQAVGNYDSLGEAVAAAVSMSTTNASDIAAQAQELDAVVARMPTGTGTLATQATVAAEQTARVDADNALGLRVNTIEVRMPTGTDQLANEARVVSAEQASVTRDNALGQSVDAVSAKLPADGGQAASEASVTAYNQASVARDNALGQRVDSVQAGIGTSNPNLLTNPSFEKGVTSWLGDTASLTPLAQLQYGAFGVFASTPGVAKTVYQEFSSPNLNAPYWLGADVFRNSATGSVRVVLAAYNGSTLVASSLAQSDGSKTAVWQRIVTSLQVPSGATRLVASLVSENTDQPSGVRRAKLEVAGAVTPYSDDVGQSATSSAVTTLQADVTTLNGQVQANAQAITSVSARTISSPNLLPNGGFENGTVGWNQLNGLAVASNGYWGRILSGGTPTNAAQDIYSDPFPVGGNFPYTFSGDALLVATSSAAQLMFDILYYDSSNTLVGYVPGPARAASFNFDAQDTARGLYKVTGTSPANAVTVRVRMRWASNGATIQAIGFRQMKFEFGNNATNYTTEAGLTQTASAAQSLSVNLNTLTGQFNAKYTLALNVNGYVTGVTSINNGTTSTFDIVADSFRVLSPAGGARTEYSNGNWRVYDASGILRVRMGVW